MPRSTQSIDRLCELALQRKSAGRQVKPDDHSEVVPLLPIPNRKVKRLCADDSADSRVKVGHRQAIYPKPRGCSLRGFFFSLGRSRLPVGTALSGHDLPGSACRAVTSAARKSAGTGSIGSKSRPARSRSRAEIVCRKDSAPRKARNVSNPVSRNRCSAPSPATAAGLRIMRSVWRSSGFAV